MRRYRRVLLTVLLAVLVALAGCNGLGGSETEADNVGDEDEQAPDDGEDPDGEDGGPNDGPDDNVARTETEPRQQVTNRLNAVASVGTSIEDGSVGVVNVTVAKAPGAANVDLRDATVQWVDASGTYDLTASSVSAGGDGHFATSTFKDDDGSAPVVNDPDDRMVLTFDLGTDDLDTDDAAGTSSFGSRLEAGSQATIKITTASGGTTTLRLVVPQSLKGKQAVTL